MNVAKFEFISATPTFASNAVTAAKTADASAQTTQEFMSLSSNFAYR
jgi:hypothetical protein